MPIIVPAEIRQGISTSYSDSSPVSMMQTMDVMFQDNMQHKCLDVMSKKRPRRVSFDDYNVKVHFVDRVEDMSTTDINATWYNKEDYENIKDHNYLTVKLMNAGREDPEKFGYCYRGLEFKNAALGERRKVNITRAFNAVFKEQNRQEICCIVDPEMLATIYSGYNHMSIDTALRQGARDAHIASKFIKEEQRQDKDKDQLQDATEATTSSSDDTLLDIRPEDDVSILSDEFTEFSLTSDNSSKSGGKRLMKKLRRMFRKGRNNKKRSS